MGMKYVVEAGDQILFRQKIGVIIPSQGENNQDFFDFISVNEEGRCTVQYTYMDSAFYTDNGATIATETTSEEFKIAAKAIVTCRC